MAVYDVSMYIVTVELQPANCMTIDLTIHGWIAAGDATRLRVVHTYLVSVG